MIRLFSLSAKLSLAVLAISLSTCSISEPVTVSIPSTTGPLEVTDVSYPFGSAATTAVPQDLSRFGYVEEEFLVTGKANVYDFDSAGKVIVKTSDAPYTTRILVRRPADTGKFSGTVIVELLNPSMMYDWDPQWMFSRDYFIERGDIWVGVTVKPVAANALKKFDPERYADISWANPIPLTQTCPQSALPSDATPETEFGLAWDIISQAGALVRTAGKQNPLKDFNVEYVYVTGYSQTGAYLLTYINFIAPLESAMLENRKPVYDGYLIGDGDLYAPPLNQCSQEFPAGTSPLIIRPRKEPVISVATEGLLSRTIAARRPDNDEAEDRYRRYEVPASSHGNILVLEFAPRPGETERIGIPAAAPNCIGPDKYGITDFPFQYLMNGAFASLDAWARSNIAPPKAQVIETESGGNGTDIRVKRNDHGNAVGGLRTPYLDIPVATYYVTSEPADEKSANFCSTQGYKVPFENEKILALYPTRDSYLGKVNGMADSMVKERFLTQRDGEKIKAEAERLSVW